MQQVLSIGSGRFRLSAEWLFALLASIGFAFCVGAGLWLGAIGLVGALACLLTGVARPLWLAMAWIVGMPTVFLLGNRLMQGVPLLNLNRSLFLVLAALLAVRALARPGSLRPFTPVEKTAGLYVLILFASWATTLSGKPFPVLASDLALLLDSFVMPLGAFVLARNLDWTDRRLERVLWLLLFAVGGYLIAVGLLEYAAGPTILNAVPEPDHADRVTGTFPNALEYGMVMGQLLFLALFLAVHSAHGIGRRVALALLSLGLLLCLVLSKGRAAWGAVPAGLALLFLKCPATRRLLAACAVAGLLVGPLVLPAVVDLSALEKRLESSGPLYNRVAISCTARDMALDRPLFGFGFGRLTFKQHKSGYYSSCLGVSPQWAVYPAVPHNEFLHVLVLAGLVGLGAYLLTVGTLWRQLSRVHRAWRGRDGPRADLAVVAQAGLLVLLINALFIDVMFLPYIVTLIFFLAGLAMRPADPAPAAEPVR